MVLVFDRIFWNPELNTFGYVNQSTASRGEMYLFWTLYSTPVLIVLIAGEAADISETHPDQVLVDRCINILRTIFGANVAEVYFYLPTSLC